jgi:hypothetical protein
MLQFVAEKRATSAKVRKSSRHSPKAALAVTSVVFLGAVVGGCKRAAEPAVGADGGERAQPVSLRGADAGPLEIARVPEDSGPAAPGIPVPLSKVEAAVNPGHLPPYAGPTGVVEGVIRVSGDPAPKRDIGIPFACGEAYATYGKGFREGTGRTLADVLIAVTGYDGFLPATGESQSVRIHGCAYDRRTVVLTYGQHLDIYNADVKETYLPLLEGAWLPAQMAAVPGGDPVKLYPTDVGHYLLRDDANHGWMSADVFVLRYPTHAVTGLDGRYRISGVPAGKVKVSSYAPPMDVQLHSDFGIAEATHEREIEVKAGETSRVDFVFAYKTPKPRPKPKEVPNRPIVK